MGMMHEASPASRDWAESRANYYAGQIDIARLALNVAQPIINHCTLKQIVRG